MCVLGFSKELKMRVAIPIVGTCVSPRFDCGAALLVAEIDGGIVTSQQEVVDGASNSLQRVAQLRELGVEVLVCGAVTGFLLRHMMANGIRVFPWVSGDAREALDALARGELSTTPLAGMGRGRGCGRRRRGRAGPRWSP
jgi:predicted Fe-Mo cluster-binding NifX family protein